MQQRRDEILAKKAKLAELKRQRELRANQATVGESRPGSISTGFASPIQRGSRPNSILSAGELSVENSEVASQANGQTVHNSTAPYHHHQKPPQQPLELATIPVLTVFECPPSPVKEVFTYSKGVQTNDDWTLPPTPRARAFSDLDEDYDLPPPGVTSTPSKRASRRLREREEELRENLRKEIEEELKAARELVTDGVLPNGTVVTANFPARALNDEELAALTASDDFVDFVDRSTKVIERALDVSNDYDILRDYSLQAHDIEDEDDHAGNTGGKGRRRVKEVVQFYDERWSKKRMVSSLDFSPAFPELLLASYTKNPSAPHDPDGVVQVWNRHLHDRPEFLFHAQSDILTAKFSPFHPNLIIGGTYSGQVLLWDTRAKSAPVQKTPLTGHGHTHPVYSVDIVGTQNANNIVSVSTDGALCVWSVDMLAQPQESLTLLTPPPNKFEDLAPTTMAFPQTDPTYFLIGSEEGPIYPCHRYDRAGAKAGVDARVSYRGHAAPVMSVAFHPARGPVDLGDLVLSSSLDWSVKLWRVRAPAATSTVAVNIGENGGAGTSIAPLADIPREDVVYDAAWSPVRPGVFALVDGAGNLEIWDLTVEAEIPVARISPSPLSAATGKSTAANVNNRDPKAGAAAGAANNINGTGGGGAGGAAAGNDGSGAAANPYRLRSLNKVAWEPGEGKRLATGGIEGVVSVFEVGSDLGGKEGARNEEWASVKKLVARLEAAGGGGAAGLL
ncbi:putative cytoplasmic dynein 1 intermediate chain 2 protein [Eutypa lata UCREL1]|uniref:Putative cytoplasmic dynein 1 intermediate chain 2 protein n=1 Tax=Eutypa lata (strain UCR-EL1) TaxID=1287681 RepID=M7SNS7_EUTLA|nr:putative cytoplasmic dynein 1 intermediate chain 2 protein [Eutypa lata UCREL1]